MKKTAHFYEQFTRRIIEGIAQLDGNVNAIAESMEHRHIDTWTLTTLNLDRFLSCGSGSGTLTILNCESWIQMLLGRKVISKSKGSKDLSTQPASLL